MVINSNVKIAIAMAGCILLIGTPVIVHEIDKKREKDIRERESIRKSEAEIERAKIEGTYPPEYWIAKKTKAECEANIKKAQIESDERLVIDARDREKAEREAIRAFEKDAPEEYWNQKKIEAEEYTKQVQIEAEQKTQQQLNHQRYETEKAMTKQHADAMRAGLYATEKLLRQNANNIFYKNLGIV